MPGKAVTRLNFRGDAPEAVSFSARWAPLFGMPRDRFGVTSALDIVSGYSA
ncbi:hypothetical protein EV562_1167 [Streptomyces sp. BK208]|uniref:hypothetical protein n=1 Tax=Streptomyces sp. BK208 TaxID=2512150 RepID=UPI0010CE9FC0|nr:hypothetical protein [Streptomyces sp. BK208]TDT27496.1 hypothetical protein EV562_1167 [Streptomyces sp. BK208]